MCKKLYTSFLLLLCLYSFLPVVEAQVICNATPVNDLCEFAIPIDQKLVQGYTCCGEIESLSLCTNSETGVWYYYEQTLNATLITVNNITISGGIGVEIYSGECDNLTLLARSDCSGFTTRDFEVPNCSGNLYIHITSTESGCGEFSICAENIEGCEFADNCEEITDALSMEPIADGAQVCVSSCMNYSCLSTCTDASVWFSFHTDNLTTAIQLQINNIDFSPMISVYRGENCTDFDDILLCQAVSPGAFTDLQVTPDFTYFVEVSLASGNPGSFDLCISAIQDYIECSDGSLTVTRPENPQGNPNGPYCPGETVIFCYDMQFYVDTPDQGNGCQWLQGIVPVLGGGWDLDVNKLEDQNPLNWFWFDDVHYNVDSPVLALGTDPNGEKILEYGPGGMQAGDTLPGGWYFVSNGTNSGCTNDGHPDNMWGVNYPCGQVYNFSHCFELTTRSVEDIEDCEDAFSRDLSITIFNFADGETGCYTSLACSGDTPVRFEGELDCSNLVDILANDTEICSGEFAEIPVEISGGYEIPIIVEVIDQGNTTGAHDWIFEKGSGLIPDQILNMGNQIETITYRASFYESESVCNTPSIEFSVLVYPDFPLDIQNEHTLCEGDTKMLSAPGGHDAYAWYNAENDEFISNSRNLIVEQGGFYRIEVTEDLCTKSQIIEVIYNDWLPLALDTEELSVCNNYIGTLPSQIDLNALLLNGVFGSWYDETGIPILDPSGLDFTGRPAEIIEYEFHTTSALPPCPDTTYTFLITIEDCQCPDLELVSPENFCALDQTLDLGSLIVKADPGSWSISSGPDLSTLQISSGEIIIDENVAEGTYGLTYTLSDPNVAPLCLKDTTLYFDVYREPDVSLVSDVSVCNVYTGTLEDILDLDDLNMSLSSGIWTALDPQIVIDPGNRIAFAGVEPGSYQLQFTTDDAKAPCLNSSYELMITVEDCSCPDVSVDPLGDICIENMIINLEEIRQTDEAGEWQIVSGPDAQHISLNGENLELSAELEEGIYTLRYTLSQSNIAPLCAQWAEVSFNAYKEPLANILSFGEACNEDTGTLADFVDLDDYNPADASGIWISSDPGVILNPIDNTVQFTTKEIRSYSFSFITNTANAPCVDQEYDLEIDLLDCSCPRVDLNLFDKLCISEQTIFLDNYKLTDEAGTWTLATGSSQQGISVNANNLEIAEDALPGLYTLNFELEDKNIGPDCPVTSSSDFLLVGKPEANISGPAIACNAPDGDDSYIIDLDDYNLDNSSGRWESVAATIVIGSDNNVSFDGISPGVYLFNFITDTAEEPCSDQEFELEIIVKDCVCPELIFEDLGNFCQEAQVFDLNELIIEAEPGVWSLVSGNGNRPEIQGSDLIIYDSTTPGSYEIKYELLEQNIPQECDKERIFKFKIFELPKSEIQEYVEVCNQYIGSLDTILDLGDMFINGDFGKWSSSEPSLPIEQLSLVNFSGVEAGEYQFYYTTITAFPPCVNATYELTVLVMDCECPQLEIDPFPDMCSDEQSIILENYIRADMQGEWTIIDGPGMSEINIESNSVLLFDTDVDAGTYTIQYAFTGEVPSLCNDVVVADFEIVELPSIIVVENSTVCNSEDSGYAPTVLDLDDYVEGSSGYWISQESSISIDSENTVNFEGIQEGDYIFEYFTDVAQDPCEDVSGLLQVRVENCVCPSIQLEQSAIFCNEEDQIALASLLLNNPGQGSWFQLNGPEDLEFIGDALLNIQGVRAGEYEFEYTITDALPTGCDNSQSFSFIINEELSLAVVDFIEVCDRSSSVAPECIDLNLMVTGAEGEWTAPPNYNGDFSDIARVCFTGISEGESFVFNYTTNAAEDGCEEKSAELIVSVLDCSCPNLDLGGEEYVCNDQALIDLKEYELPETVDGQWSFIDGPESVTLNDGVFDSEYLSAGEYVFQFTPSIKPPESCSQDNRLSIEIEEWHSAGTGTAVEFCDNEQLVLSFYDLIDDEDQGGSWALSASSHPAFDFNEETVDIAMLQPGEYTMSYHFEALQACSESVAYSEITIHSVPVADAGPDLALSCMQSEFNLGGENISTGSEFDYIWTETESGQILDSNTAHPSIEEAGTYMVEVIHKVTGCSEFDEVEVIDNSEQLYFEYSIENPDCIDPDLASIQIFNASGGDGDYSYSIDGGASWNQNGIFGNLNPGSYTLLMTDGNNCDLEEMIQIESGIHLNVWAGDDMEIEFGDEWIPLQLFTDAMDDEILEIIWTMDEEIICQGGVDDCYNIEVNPYQYNEFCVTVIDINGCEDSDCMSIREIIDPKVYIPNVFRPGSYDKNSWFFVQSNDHVETIESILIMDRWGGTVFELSEAVPPNEAETGWDGRKLQREVEVGVYTYYIVVKDVYGELHQFGGEVTVLR